MYDRCDRVDRQPQVAVGRRRIDHDREALPLPVAASRDTGQRVDAGERTRLGEDVALGAARGRCGEALGQRAGFPRDGEPVEGGAEFRMLAIDHEVEYVGERASREPIVRAQAAAIDQSERRRVDPQG